MALIVLFLSVLLILSKMKQLIIFLLFILFQTSFLFGQNSSNQSYSGNSLADSITVELPGTIKSKVSDIITVQFSEAENIPLKSTIATLSKHFDSVVFGFKTTGWLDIGNVQVISCEKGMLKLKLISEKSPMTVNDQKVDHFKPGNEVKLIWKIQSQ